MNDSEKEAEDIVIKFSTDMDSCPTEIELECLRDSIADKLKSKQDEIERLNKKMSEKEVRCCKGCPDCMGIGAREQLKDNQKEIQSLTARNKALEHIIYLGLVNGTVDYSRWKSEAVRALESSKDYEDFKKSEKAMLETINQQGDEIKELKQALSGRTVSCEACNGMADKVKELEVLLDKKVLSQVKEDREKILSLESKIAVLEKNKTYYVYEGSDLEAFELNRLETKLAVAREALEFYASFESDENGFGGVDGQGRYRDKKGNLDKGKMAQQALAELGEKQ